MFKLELDEGGFAKGISHNGQTVLCLVPGAVLNIAFASSLVWLLNQSKKEDIDCLIKFNE